MSAEHKKFISTKEASTLVGRSSDYIGRLAREGKIPASRIGRSWVVEKDALLSFFDITEAVKEIKKETLSKNRKEDYKKIQKTKTSLRKNISKALDKVSFESAVPLALAVTIVFGGYSLVQASPIATLPQVFVEAVHNQVSQINRALVQAQREPKKTEVRNYVVAINNDHEFTQPPLEKVISGDGLIQVASLGLSYDYKNVRKKYSVTYSPSKNISLPTGADIWLAYKGVGESLVATSHSVTGAYIDFVEALGQASLKNALAARNFSSRISALSVGSYVQGVAGFVEVAQSIPSLQANFVYKFVDTSFVVANTLSGIPYKLGDIILASSQSIPEANVKVGKAIRSNAPGFGNALMGGYVKFIYAFVDNTNKLTSEYLKSVEGAGNQIGGGYAYLRLEAPEIVTKGIVDAGSSVTDLAILGIESAGKSIATNVLVPTVEVALSTSERSRKVASDSASTAAAKVSENVGKVAFKTKDTQANVFGSVVGGAQNIFDRIFGRKQDPVVLVNPGPAQTNLVVEEKKPVYVAPSSLTQNFYTATDVNKSYVDSSIVALHAALSAELQKLTSLNRSQISQNIQTIQWVNKIEDISDTIIRRPEIIGGFLRGVEINEGSTFNGGDVTATTGTFESLTAGTLTAATTTLTGPLTIPTLVASGTTTLATTTLTGPLVGTTAEFTSGTTTNATSTNLYTGNLVAGTSTLTNLIGTNATITSATTTSFYTSLITALTGVFTDLTATNATTTNATTTNLAISSLTQGSVPFIGAGGLVVEDNDNFFFDNALKRLGVGTSSPSTEFEVDGVITATGALGQFLIKRDNVNTGLYVDGSGNIGLSVNGGQVLTGESGSANVGVFTTNPAFRFETEGSNDQGYFGVTNAVDGDIFQIDGSGNVGIGTTSPYAKLSVVGQTVAEYFTATSTSVASTFPLLSSTNATSTQLAVTSLTQNRVPYISTGGRLIDSSNLTFNGSRLTSLVFDAQSTTATSTFAGGLAVETSGFVYDWQTNNVGIGTAVPVNTLDVAGGVGIGAYAAVSVAPTNGLIVSGNVGVGTSSPYAKLSVVGQTVAEYFTATSTSVASTFPLLSSTNATSTQLAVNSLTSGRVPYATTGGRLIDSSNLTFDGSQLTAANFVATNGTTTNATSTNLSVSGTLNLSGLTASRALFLDANNNAVGSALSSVLADSITDETGTGSLVFSASPTFTGTANFANYIATNGTTTNATSTSLFTSAFGVGSGNYFTSLLGNGLANINGALSVATSSLASGFFLQDGNSFGATAVLGTNDSNDLAFETNGSTRLTIAAGGNVGISTSTPWAQFSVEGQGGYPSFVVSDASNNTDFIVTEVGNVGIGTTTPPSKLTIDTTSDSDGITFASSGTVVGTIAKGVTNGASVGLAINSASTGRVLGIGGLVASNISIGAAGGNVGIGTTTPGYPLDVNGDFRVGEAGSSNALFVDATNGRAGIGTASPSNALHILNTNPTIHLEDSDGSSSIYAQLQSNGQGGLVFIADPGAASGSTQISFELDGAEVGRFNTGGNFGVGTTSPYAKLSVTGPASGDSFVVSDSSGNTDFVVQADGTVAFGIASPNADYYQFAAPDNTAAVVFSDLNGNYRHVFGTDSNSDPYWRSFNGTDLNFGIDSTNVLTIASTTNQYHVGVGTSTPWGKFSVVNTYATPSFIVADEAGDTTPFLIDASGNVGVGVTEPLGKLHVAQTVGSYNQVFTFNSGYSNERDFGIRGVNNAANTQTALHIDALSTAGAFTRNLLTLDHTGNVGIGTTTPTQKLSVWGDVEIGDGSGDNNLYAYSDARTNYGQLDLYNGSTGNITLTTTFSTGDIILTPGSSGGVGIGTTTPDGKLTVESEGSTLNTILTHYDDSTPVAIIARSANGTQASPTAVTDGKSLFSFGARGHDGTSFVTGNKGVARFIADGDWTGSNNGTDFVIELTPNGSTSRAEVLRVDSSGNVGIGTSTPDTLLTLSTNGANDLLKLERSDLADTNLVIDLDGGLANFRIPGGSEFTFNEGGTEHVRIDSSGNVGIGTTTPQSPFHIYSGTAGNQALIERTSAADVALGFKNTEVEWAIGVDQSDNNTFKIGQDVDNIGNSNKLQLNRGGSLGLGISPVQILHVASSTSPFLRLDNIDSTIVAADVLGGIEWYTNDSTATAGVSAYINALAINSFSSSLQRTALTFATSEVAGDLPGVERLRIDYNGNIGIATTSPWAQLSVEGQGSVPSLVVSDTSNNTDFIVTASGNAGIGTTSPQSQLAVYDNTRSNGTLFSQLALDTSQNLSSGTAGGGNLISFENFTGTTGAVGGYMAAASNYGIGVWGGTKTGNPNLFVNNSGNIGIGTTSPETGLHIYNPSTHAIARIESEASSIAALQLRQAGTTTQWLLESGRQGVNDFNIYQGNGIGAALTITNAGYVGVGTTTPDERFKLVEAGNAILSVHQPDASANGKFAQLILTNGPSYFGASDSSWQIAATGKSDGTSDLAFHNWHQGSYSKTNILYLDSGGNVGIGTTTPQRALSVVGQVAIDSAGGTDTEYLNFTASGGTTIGGIGRDTNDIVLYSPFGIRLTEGSADVLTIADGKVGIGTSSPASIDYPNAFANSSSESAILVLQGNTSGDGDTGIFLRRNDDLTGLDIWSNSGNGDSYIDNVWNSTGGDIHIRTRTKGDANVTDVATFTGTGKVGIGDTAPGSKLDVAGDINISDTTTGYKIGDNMVLYASTTNYSTAVGIFAGTAVLNDGYYNTALGDRALNIATSSDYNTAIGAETLRYNTTGLENTVVGALAGENTTTGSYNTVVGSQALRTNTTGNLNTALGRQAMYFNTTGAQNTAVGYASSFLGTTALANVAVGYASLYSNKTGAYNTAIGQNALYNNNATSTVAIGYGAGQGSAGAASQNNVFVGFQAGTANTTGNNNTIIGYQAGYDLTTGRDNILIGYGVVATSTTATNYLNIGNTIYGNLSAGIVGLGTTTPGTSSSSGILDLVRSADNQSWIFAGQGANGRFAIGTDSSANVTFKTFNSLDLRLGVGTPDDIVIKSSGNVGIGTTTPSGNFAVSGSLYAPILHLGSTGSSAYIDQGLWYDGSAANAWFNANVPIVFNPAGQKVGVGTTSPWAMLSVTNAGSGPSFVVEDSASPDTTHFIIDSVGKVGVATSTGAAQLAVANSFSVTGPSDIGFYVSEISGAAQFLGLSKDASTYNPLEIRAQSSQQIYLPSSSSNVGLGTKTPDEGKVEVKGGSVCVDTNSDDTASSCIANESDERLKTNIATVSGALDILQQLRGVSFDWRVNDPVITQNYSLINRFASQPHSYGLIAQEVMEVLPYAISSETVGEGAVQYYQLDYEKLIPFLVEGVKDLDIRTSEIATLNGNIGIGTTTPTYKLHVLGDVAATSFVNISTRESKNGITYLDEARKEDILSKLKAVQIAEYRYNYESDSNPLRLGLIAEEAPSEVLSASGKGVDIYKLATFTLASVQEIAFKLETLEERIAALEASGVISTGGGVFSTTTLKSAFLELGVLIEKGFAQFDKLAFKQLIAQKDSAGEAAAGNGTILAGNKLVLVENNQIKASSKVFITFTSPVVGSWFITDKANGSFRVTLDVVQATDVTFDYFIVQTEKDQAPTSSTGVVDTEKPVITIIGANPYYLATGTEYVEPGVTITDNVDQGLTYDLSVDGYPAETHPLDTSVPGEHILTYKVIDTAGNLVTATRAVVVGSGAALGSSSTGTTTPPTTGTTTPPVATTTPPVVVEEEATDTVKPTITLLGKAALKITVGDTFTDAGATATDDVDGDITADIVVSGAVDTATAGLYTLTYSVEDTAGNSATVSRIVTVEAPVESEEAPIEDVVE